MLDYKTGERHGKVITKTFLADFQRKSLAVIAVLGSFYTILVVIYLGESVTGIKYAEKMFVTFFSVLSKQSAQILHGRWLDGSIAVSLEN